MAKASGARKPANQGSPGTPKVQKPAKSGVPKLTNAPTTAQNKRGYHTPGTHGTGKGTH